MSRAFKIRRGSPAADNQILKFFYFIFKSWGSTILSHFHVCFARWPNPTNCDLSRFYATGDQCQDSKYSILRININDLTRKRNKTSCCTLHCVRNNLAALLDHIHISIWESSHIYFILILPKKHVWLRKFPFLPAFSQVGSGSLMTWDAYPGPSCGCGC